MTFWQSINHIFGIRNDFSVMLTLCKSTFLSLYRFWFYCCAFSLLVFFRDFDLNISTVYYSLSHCLFSTHKNQSCIDHVGFNSRTCTSSKLWCTREAPFLVHSNLPIPNISVHMQKIHMYTFVISLENCNRFQMQIFVLFEHEFEMEQYMLVMFLPLCNVER